MANTSKRCMSCGRGGSTARNYFKVSNGIVGEDRFFFFDGDSIVDGKAALKAARRSRAELGAHSVRPWSLSVWARVPWEEIDVIGEVKLEVIEARERRTEAAA